MTLRAPSVSGILRSKSKSASLVAKPSKGICSSNDETTTPRRSTSVGHLRKQSCQARGLSILGVLSFPVFGQRLLETFEIFLLAGGEGLHVELQVFGLGE